MNKVVNTESPKSVGPLDELNDLLGYMESPDGACSDGGPLLLPIGDVYEDPGQPRTESNPGFSRESLEELAGTIRERGIKTPISVRREGERYVINHGARRYRAAKLARLERIPAYIDADYSEFDQVVENLQRNALTSREIADVIGRHLGKGMSRAKIARAIGKSAAFVTQHAALLDLPEVLDDVYRSGRCSDVTVLYDLLVARRKSPEAVDSWLETEEEITRVSARTLKKFLRSEERKRELALDATGSESDSDPELVHEPTDKPEHESSSNRHSGNASSSVTESSQDRVGDSDVRKERSHSIQPEFASAEETKYLRKPPKKMTASHGRVNVSYNGVLYSLDLTRRPSACGHAWIKREGENEDVLVSDLELAGVEFT